MQRRQAGILAWSVAAVCFLISLVASVLGESALGAVFAGVLLVATMAVLLTVFRADDL